MGLGITRRPTIRCNQTVWIAGRHYFCLNQNSIMCTFRSVIAALLVLTILGQSTLPCQAATSRACRDSDSCGCGLSAGSTDQDIPRHPRNDKQDFPREHGESPTCPFCQSQVNVSRDSTAELRINSSEACTSCVDVTSDDLTLASNAISRTGRSVVRIAESRCITLCRLLR